MTTRMIAFIVSLLKRLFRLEPAAVSIESNPKTSCEDDDSYCSGRYQHLDDLLHDLGAVSGILKAIRRADKDGYNLISRIGAPIIPTETVLGEGNNEEIVEGSWPLDWTAKLPSVILTLLPEEELSDRTRPRAIYFLKSRHIDNVQFSNGTIYRGAVVYKPKQEKLGVSAPLYLSVSKDGSITALKVREEAMQRFKHQTVISRGNFDYPSVIKFLASERGVSEDVVASDIFKAALSASFASESGFQVLAEKNGTAIRFSIGQFKAVEFFKDRNKDAGGGKIFHIVRTHVRKYKDGSESYVRTHFRGKRKFSWNGYNINITLPGLHHQPISSLKVEEVARGSGTATHKHLGELVNAKMKSKVGNKMPSKVST